MHENRPIKKLGQGNMTNGSRKNNINKNKRAAFSFKIILTILKLKYRNNAYTTATTRFCIRNLAPKILKSAALIVG